MSPANLAKPIPRSVRYVKLGEKGRWWRASRDGGELHGGWGAVPDEMIASRDYEAIEAFLRELWGDKRGATQDVNMLFTMLKEPSRHVWITFEDGYLWWCTVTDQVTVNPDRSDPSIGHFWLKCVRPWSNASIGGRTLEMANLPGSVTATAGYRATACEPTAAAQVLRLVLDEVDPEVTKAHDARREFEVAVGALVRRLGHKDFELLVDLVLARSGWARVAKLGGATEGIDVEVENPATGEIAFVQVKSVAQQGVLDDYVGRFQERRGRYQRMIFAVHSTRVPLEAPADAAVQVWDVTDIARLTVRLGLSDWVSSRI